MLAMFFFIALYMQNIKGYSPLEAGVRFLPSTVVIIVIGPIAGRLSDRIGPRPLMTLGLVLVADLAVLAGPPRGGHELRLPRRRASSLMGIGMGLVMSPMSTAAMNAVDQSKAGVASGVLIDEPDGRRHASASPRMGALIAGLGRSRIDDLLPPAARAAPATSSPTRSAPAARARRARPATRSTRPSSTR